jgi:hypothetical protein
MTTKVTCCVAILAFLGVVSPACADSCAPSIARVQAQVDAAIEKRAGTDGWKPESHDATRNHQPTAFSLATTEGERGRDLEVALDSLERARAADRVGDVAVCRHELASARATLRQQHQQ